MNGVMDLDHYSSETLLGIAEAGRHTIIKSPLRYPGGKSRAVKILLDLIPSDTKNLCSPFMGGGSLELACASLGVRVFGYDLFKPVVDFWKCALEDSNKLSDIISGYHPLSKDDFYPLQSRHISGIHDQWESAAAFFVLNRCSFSGTTMSGGISPGHPRFNESSIERVRKINVPGLTVGHASFEDSIRRHEDCFLYLDPPYLLKNSNLYGRRGDHHREFSHVLLADMLKERGSWILSYNDCEEVRELYSGFRVLSREWAYGMTASRKSNEIVIVSHDLRIV